MITIFQCVRGESDEHILKFCIVRNYNGENNPLGTLQWECGGWYAHDNNHNRIYWSKNENISI